jgi:hypothetical protein
MEHGETVCLGVTMCIRSGRGPFQDRRHCAARHSLEHTLTCLCRPFSQLLKFCRKITKSPQRDCINVLLETSTESIGVRFGDRGHHTTPLDYLCTFLDMSHSTRAWDLHSALSSVVLKPQLLPHSYRHIFKQPRQKSFRISRCGKEVGLSASRWETTAIFLTFHLKRLRWSGRVTPFRR